MAIQLRHLAPPRRALPWHNDSARASFVAVALFLTAGTVPASAQSPFSTSLGFNSLQGVGHDAAGNIYVVGTVNNSPIPNHGMDFVAARLDPNAAKVDYLVYLGGSGNDEAQAMTVDPQGDVYITGYTQSSDFPVTSGFSGPVPSGATYPFVVKLDPKGAIVYATLFAGALSAYPGAISVESDGSVIITGTAPTPQGYAATPGAFSWDGDSDHPFVTKLDPSGTKIVFSATGVGGSLRVGGGAVQIVLGSQGDIFLAGSTNSTSYPTTPGAFQPTFDTFDACLFSFCDAGWAQYLTRLSADGTHLIYSTFLAGSSGDTLNTGLAVDSAGNAYVTGVTGAKDYPYTSTLSSSDRTGLFLTKLDPTGANVIWSVRQGGASLASDAAGNLVVGGYSCGGPNSSVLGLQCPSPPPTGNTPAACLPNGTNRESIAVLQSFSAQDGSAIATRILSDPAWAAEADIVITVEPDGRVLLGGQSNDPVGIPLTPGVVFSGTPTLGVYLAAVDLSQTATGTQLSCVTDGATFDLIGTVAPGQLVSLFGNQLGPQTGVSGFSANQTSFPTSLANVQVTFDGMPAPLLYVSSGQINVQVPFEVAPRASTVMTISIAPDSSSDYTAAASQMFAIAQSLPSLFLDMSVSPATCDPTLPGDSEFAVVALNEDGSRNACANPAKPGSTVTVFLNGVAATLGGSFPATGSINASNASPLSSQVEVTGAILSLSTSSVTLTAGPLFPMPGSIAGVDQLAIQLPGTAPSGLQEAFLAVSLNGMSGSPSGVIVWVKQ
jgi:uncharacterized protein (TIGR03437 family)